MKIIKRLDLCFRENNHYLLETIEAYANMKQVSLTRAIKELLEIGIISSSNGLEVENGRLIKKEIIGEV